METTNAGKDADNTDPSDIAGGVQTSLTTVEIRKMECPQKTKQTYHMTQLYHLCVFNQKILSSHTPETLACGCSLQC